MRQRLRVVIADDERPARAFLASLLQAFDDVLVVGEAASGTEAIELIEREKPDLALLDLQMPEMDGLGVARRLRKKRATLVAFVTAYDEYAVNAFGVNAVDYLLKPVDRLRLRETLNRAHERLEREAARDEALEDTGEAIALRRADSEADQQGNQPYLERLPIRKRDEILILPVEQIASIIAEGELLHITTIRNERHTIAYRLKDLENRLDPKAFVRLGRGTLARLELITRVNAMPGGTYIVTLSNRQQLSVSRLQSRILREQLLRL